MSYLLLQRSLLYWLAVAPARGRGAWKFNAIVAQTLQVGVRALPMVALTSLSLGLTLAMQAAASLRQLGATMFVPDLVAVSLLRELGPLIVAIVVIGRSGSAITAELGTMKVGEEIDALRAMAIDPVRYLVVPRFVATLVMMPLLTVFGDCVGITGGWLVCRFALDTDTAAFVLRALERADVWDLYSGLLKSVVFGWLTGLIACTCGLGVEGGAQGVGTATTASVVRSLLWVLAANALLTGLFFFV